MIVSFRMDRARGTPPGKEIKCTHTEAPRDGRFENISENAICAHAAQRHMKEAARRAGWRRFILL
ncbi:hypothetical protein EK904_009737 [Melospiza melodia maxima]|nr:hypothetical protein EK904_009737 [Melospiza melodia maxima]